MTSSGQDDPSPPPELQGLDAKYLLQAGLETVPPVTLPPQPVDADATLPVARPQSTQPAAQVELPLPEELTTLLPGGNYHVESFLGQGGMGAVYKGMQVRLKRPVAIKIMRRDMGKDYDFEARFEREAQAMAKLNHPNIVSVIDYGEAGPDYLYIVMELIDGADLMDVIRGGQMTQEMALSLLPQICDALQFAHDHGIVHRDIKPSNIMVTRDGRVKMADFGLAKPMDGIESGFRTQTGTGMGTPDYAAPEQFDPSGHIDHRADIYALGVMIYQMITGQLPRGAWKPPSQRAAVAPQWDEIVSRAMQSDPSDRYQQASEVKTDVSSIPLRKEGSADTPVRAASKSGEDAKTNEAHKSVRAPVQSRAPLIFGLLAGAVVIALGAFFALRGGKTSGPAVASTAPSATRPTAPATASTTKAAATSAQIAAPALPESGWQKVITDWDKIAKTKGVTVLPGEWVRLEKGYIHGPGGKDGALKATFRFAGRESAGINLRERNPPGMYHRASIAGDGATATLYRQTMEGNESVLAKGRIEPPLRVGQDYELAIVGKGDALAVYVNGKAIVQASDNTVNGTSSVVWARDATEVKGIFWHDLKPAPAAPKVPVGASPVASATKDKPFTNTLGMKFVPVPGTQVLFSIWLTRVQDYAAFVNAQEAAGKKVVGSWKTQQKDGVPVGQEPDHPVVHVNWDDAQAFCAWLTEKDTAAGKLPQGAKYRLPTDAEWSTAVGLPPEPGTTPEEKHWKNDVDYPWGKEWPPTKKVGNYADETFHAKFPVKRNEQSNRDDNLWIEGYTDGYATTSPVGSFPANAYGLYDMGGNVWQWCEDWFNKSQTNRVLRGASWAHTGPAGPRSSSRHPRAAIIRDGVHGFRVVLEPVLSTAAAEPWQAPEPTVSVGTEWTNLLPHIQPPRDSIRGEWVLDQKGLHAKRAEWAICNLPVQDPGTDYDLRCQVTRGEGLHLAMFFAFRKGNTGGYVPIDYFGGGVDFADGQRWATIENITPLDIRDSASIKAKRKEWLPRGKACTVLLQVREKEVIVSVDDTEAFRWPAEWSKLQQKGGVGSPMFSEVSGGPIFGVGIFNCEAIFHRIEMRRVGNAAAAASSPIFSSATKDAPFVNTLGMKFVPVPGTPALFSIWPTRVQDYEAFAKAQEAAGKPVDGSWKTQQKGGVPVGREPDHPVVSVNWDDAQAFCAWLTTRDQSLGRLPHGLRYRLPSDEEWSWAVGLPAESGATPEKKHGKNDVDYPWGKEWPPTKKVGNYADETFHARFPVQRNAQTNQDDNLWIEGYTDGYATTSPVGSFPANAHGLYDMGGNVWQWCEDWWNNEQKDRVLRGASWFSLDRNFPQSAYRNHHPATSRGTTFGFRCVISAVSAPAPTSLGPSTAAVSPSPSAATKDAPFVNTLGMKFVPVSGTPALFSIWHTRVQDYAAFAMAQEAAGKPVSGAWKNQEKDGVPVGRELDHPVVSVNWDEAQAFCAWLTEKETAAGKLPLGAKYRLPTDAEWSTAVGLPPEQGATPEEKHNKNTLDFPWGKTWPPPPNAGNYADETFHAAFPLTRNEKDNRNENLWIKGYTDGFATTSPVGRFPANAYGLYDMGGNAWQWCEDWFNKNQTARVLRGASWKFEDRSYLLSSNRGRGGPPTIRVSYNGFRCVLVPNTTKVAAAAENWEVAQEDSGKMARIADGWRVEGSLIFKNGPARDGAVRVRAPFTPELQNLRLVGRRSADGQDLYQVFINSDGARASIQRRTKGEYTGVEGLAATPLAIPLKPGEPCELEARFVGPEINVKINGQTVLQGDHQALAEGSFGLYTGASMPVTLKSIEFLNLDERPTSEPWQDMLQDLRFGVYGAVERTPEGLHFSSKGTARLKQGTLRDMSVRLTSTFTGKIGPQVNVRVSTKGSYHLFVKDNRTLRWGRWDEAAQQTVMQKEFHLDKPLATGQEYQLELRVIGQTFTAKLDGKIVGTATDGPPTSGELGAGVAGPEATSIVITALEFLNLDEPGSASPSLPLSNSPSSATGDSPIINDRGR